MEGSRSGETNSSFFTVCTDKEKLYLGAPSVLAVIGLVEAAATIGGCCTLLSARFLLGATDSDVLAAVFRTLGFVRCSWLERKGLGFPLPAPWLLSVLEDFAPWLIRDFVQRPVSGVLASRLVSKLEVVLIGTAIVLVIEPLPLEASGSAEVSSKLVVLNFFKVSCV